jgi:hypothetical protein
MFLLPNFYLLQMTLYIDVYIYLQIIIITLRNQEDIQVIDLLIHLMKQLRNISKSKFNLLKSDFLFILVRQWPHIKIQN